MAAKDEDSEKVSGYFTALQKEIISFTQLTQKYQSPPASNPS
jgi:hypothetical protein